MSIKIIPHRKAKKLTKRICKEYYAALDKLADKQEKLPSDFEKVLVDNIWEL